jgi:hypothetical protein
MLQTADDTVTVIFSDLTPAEAAELAKEFEAELLLAGLPREAVALQRQSADAQDLGTAVLLGGWALDLLEFAGKEYLTGVARQAGARTLDWLLKKWGTRAVIRRRSGEEVVLGHSTSGRDSRMGEAARYHQSTGGY